MPRNAPRKNKLGSSLRRTQLTKSGDTSTKRYRFSVRAGDLLCLDGNWYVTHSGLIRLARRARCAGIHVEPVAEFSDPGASRWAFKATVYKSLTCMGFVGYGDADPSNVSSMVHGAEMRVAETRAVNRALRKAYAVGLCSADELGCTIGTSKPPQDSREIVPRSEERARSAHSKPPAPVRDQLCQIIRQHQLDPVLVKAYAVDFCGTRTLRDATREQVENFVAHLSDWAEKDRNALLCQLNSYLKAKEGAA